jgi:isopenicillin-N N-acyltransferase-like protein
MVRKILKIVLWICISILSIILLAIILIFAGVHPRLPGPPTHEKSIYRQMAPVEKDSGVFVLGNNWIRKNRYGIWEMYIEGDPFNRGVAAGKLSEQLVKYQEKVFVSQIDQVVPSKRYQRFLLVLISWFNKDITKMVKPEYLEEIYGISLSASHDYDEFGPPYLRILNYHAAHDIGHAMQGYYLVGCSSFATWNEKSLDSTLIIGRNFDFYFGDDFGKNKIVEFVAPEKGHKFAFITWGGMIGVVSGMNDQGLTVTINAGTTEIGRHSGTPVSLVARDILQYASNIKEAVKIASSYKVFVAESFLIGSAGDRKAVIIEKRPTDEAITWPDSSSIICTNHFQSKEFSKMGPNIENRSDNATGYRFLRLTELLNESGKLDPFKAASILRNQQGLNNKDIGIGNEKALNQMLAHHSVLFEPEKRIMWVSTPPNVMGPYLAYDLNLIFSDNHPLITNRPIDRKDLEIPADTFLLSQKYKNYIEYKMLNSGFRKSAKEHTHLPDSILIKYLTLNPENYETYTILGDYYFRTGDFLKSKKYYEKGLTKEPNNKNARNYMKGQLDKIKNEK